MYIPTGKEREEFINCGDYYWFLRIPPKEKELKAKQALIYMIECEFQGKPLPYGAARKLVKHGQKLLYDQLLIAYLEGRRDQIALDRTHD